MLFRVGDILKLLRNERIGRGGVQFVGLCDCPLHAVLARCEYELGTVGGNELAALNRHRVGHREDKLVAFYGRNQGETDTRVSACRLDERSARLQNSGLFRGFDHCEGDTVLYRSAGIEIFDFDDDFSRALVQVADTNERCIAN